jgi:hypothetical protein
MSEAIPGRGRRDADALRDIMRDYALETLADDESRHPDSCRRGRSDQRPAEVFGGLCCSPRIPLEGSALEACGARAGATGDD